MTSGSPEMASVRPSVRRLRRLRRPLALVGTLLLVAGAGGIGWWAALRFESPAQRAAAATAPTPMPVFATVQRGTLSELITANATVTTAERHEIVLTIPQGAPVAAVTRQFVIDGTIGEAAPVLAVNDRPVFAISGDFPFWRDLSPGMSGDDVRQLQESLRAAGHVIGDREFGTFGRGTAAAVKAMYRAADYPTASADPAPAEAADGTGSPEGQASVTRVLVVPADELVVVPGGLPAHIAAIPAIGTVLTTENATISVVAGAPKATADMPEGVASRATPGMGGTLRVGEDDPVAVVVSQVVAGDVTAAVGSKVILVAADEAAIPESWVGGQGILELTLTTVATDSLLVPSRAVAVRADGTASVLKREADGSLVIIVVSDLGDLRGVSAVEAVDEGTLVVGDQVQVG